MSGTRRLPNGNTLITVATELKIFEVDSDGDIVWEYNHNEFGQNSISKSFKYSLDYLSSDTEILGDSNNDYNIDVLDLILIVRFILELEFPDDSQVLQSDINQDGDISISDVIMLLDIILT